MKQNFIKPFYMLFIITFSLLSLGMANGFGCNYKLEGIDEKNGRVYKGTCQHGILTYYALDKHERRLSKGIQINFINKIIFLKFYQESIPTNDNRHYLSMPAANTLQGFKISDMKTMTSGRRVMVFTSSFPERKILKVKISGNLSFLDLLGTE